MKLQRQRNGEIVTLDTENPLAGGGEGRIYSIRPDPSLVAKIYHNPSDDDADKLAVMLSMPPDAPTVAPGHSSIAWPIDLLRTNSRRQKIVGYLMPRVIRAEPIHIFYTPKNRREQKPLFNYLYLHRAGRNLVAAVNALHNSGYIIGDVNESNILVTDTALVTLVDTDSFQVHDIHTDYTYRCSVGKPEFTPPELQRVSFRDINRTIEHDLFGLGVLIFQLLMEGTHPYAGVYKGRGEPPTIEARIGNGHFPYGTKRVPYRPMPLAPDFQILHPTLRDLFIECFDRGHEEPSARPDTITWLRALKEAEEELAICSKNPQHRYGKHLNSCPWCDRTKKLKGRDPFPSREAVRNKQHLQPVAQLQKRKLSPQQQPKTTPKKPEPRTKPVRIAHKMGQYQPLLTPITPRSSAPPPMRIPVSGGGRGIPGIVGDAVSGAIWGVLLAAGVMGVVFGTYEDGGALIGAIVMGLFWGAFFGKSWEYLMPGTPSRVNPVIIGGVGGLFVAAALGGVVFGTLHKLAILGRSLVFGGILGSIWGGFWSGFKPPLSLATSGRVSGRRGLFLGAIWGAFFGAIAAALLTVIFVVTGKFDGEINAWRDLILMFVGSMIPAVGVGVICGILAGAVFGSFVGAPTLPLPMQLLGIKGAALGAIWGCFLGAIAGAVFGSLLPAVWPAFFISILRVSAQSLPFVSTIFVAGLGALGGFFSGAVWGAMGKW